MPWWYISISGLNTLITLSPIYLVSMGTAGKGGGLLWLSSGLYNLTLLAIALMLSGGAAAVYGSYLKKKAFTLTGGILVLSSVNLLTYAFLYLEVAGAVLCQTPSLFGGPLDWGLSYGFAFSALCGLIILLSMMLD
jgi:hypothetical protein